MGGTGVQTSSLERAISLEGLRRLWRVLVTLVLSAALGLPNVWNQGYTGRGVTVALLDTGVSQVPDLGNRVLARADLTQEQDGWDHFGHGTHMAGIIAGDGTSAGDPWSGVAPRANLVSVKVAGADGSTDVSVVIAGLQWVVAHQNDYNIQVLNLSFGTDSTQSYVLDPLDYAVERSEERRVGKECKSRASRSTVKNVSIA